MIPADGSDRSDQNEPGVATSRIDADIPAGKRSDLARHFRMNLSPLRSRALGEQAEIVQDGELWVHGGDVLGVHLADGVATVSARVQRSEDGFDISGTATAQWSGECRRCLDPISGPVIAEFDEHVSSMAPNSERGRRYSGSAPDDLDDDNAIEVVGDVVDLSVLIRESLVFALPLTPLCDESCKGPDPTDHPISSEDDVVVVPSQDGDGDVDSSLGRRDAEGLQVDGPGGHVERQQPRRPNVRTVDPRWAALENFRPD